MTLFVNVYHSTINDIKYTEKIIIQLVCDLTESKFRIPQKSLCIFIEEFLSFVKCESKSIHFF